MALEVFDGLSENRHPVVHGRNDPVNGIDSYGQGGNDQ
jgi:hypothetical protein